MKVIDRLSKYLKLKGIPPHAFEQKCGLANGYIGKQLKAKGSVGSDILEKVGEVYPDLNLVWLITGRGKILVKPRTGAKDNNDGSMEVKEAEAVYAVRDKLIEVLKEQLETLSSAIPGRRKKGRKTGD